MEYNYYFKLIKIIKIINNNIYKLINIKKNYNDYYNEPL